MTIKWFRGLKLSYSLNSGIFKGCTNLEYHYYRQNIDFSKTLRKPPDARISNKAIVLPMKSRIPKSSNSSRSTVFSSSSGVDKKSIAEMLEKAEVTVKSSNKEIVEIFASASNNLDKSSDEMIEETQRKMGDVKNVLNNMIQGLNVRDKSVAECLSKYEDDLEGVRTKFIASLKFCNETAMKKLKESENSGEITVQKATVVNNLLKNNLENCKDDDEALENFCKTENIKIQQQLSDLIRKLIEIPNEVKNNTAEILKQAMECHLRAQAKAIEEFGKILAKSSECLSEKKESLSRFVESQERLPPQEEKTIKNPEDEICMKETRDRVKMVVNMLRQDLLSCNAYLIEITIPGRDTRTKQEILLEIQELLTYLRKVSRGCAQASDLFSYVKERISNLENKVAALSEIIKKKFPHVENSQEKSTALEMCFKKAIENAVKKLEKLEKNCIPDMEKKRN